jgi:Asp-tRNA(Asn)/Glu-tRNA(Gln) amidotransferase A subunit family amidase
MGARGSAWSVSCLLLASSPREVAALMERVVEELGAAGAAIVDVTIPDLDAQYRAARGGAPGSLEGRMDRLSDAGRGRTRTKAGSSATAASWGPAKRAR